ncbi:MAG: PepSY-associated TM helix domain-containing protein [Bacteroidetes bacterium]|nr:PepSY-associated TM helix domain-containing protein [Bacteroidota bacterium]
MPKWDIKKIRRLNVATHRDLGYFFSTLILIYCISGIALNHVDDWNADFILTKKEVSITEKYSKSQISDPIIRKLGELVQEEDYKVFDFPTHDQVKIYYNNASLHVYLDKNKAIYEQVSKRPFFYQTNVIHRNSLKGWKWASDIFAVLLIVITITGLFILKGKHGITGRGKWLIAAGFLPPIIAIIIQAFQ